VEGRSLPLPTPSLPGPGFWVDVRDDLVDNFVFQAIRGAGFRFGGGGGGGRVFGALRVGALSGELWRPAIRLLVGRGVSFGSASKVFGKLARAQPGGKKGERNRARWNAPQGWKNRGGPEGGRGNFHAPERGGTFYLRFWFWPPGVRLTGENLGWVGGRWGLC